MRQLLLVLSVLFLSTACSNFHMEKRRYNKGFHISFNKNRAKEKADTNKKKIASNNQRLIKSVENQTKNTAQTILAEIPVTNQAIESENEVVDVKTSGSEPSSTASNTDNTIKVEQVSSTDVSSLESNLKSSESKENGTSSGLWYFALMGMIPVLMATKKPSYKIGLWASENVSKAKVVMAGLYALGFSSSYALGNIWQPSIEEWMLVVPLTLAGSILVADVVKKEKKSGFIKRQMASAAINVSSFFGTFALGAESKIDALQLMDPEAQTGMEPWAAILITLFLVALMVVAFLGIAMLACELSCSGYGVLALFVLAGGSFLILFLGIWGILTAIRGRSRNRDNLMAGLIAGVVAALLILVPVGIAYLIGF